MTWLNGFWFAAGALCSVGRWPAVAACARSVPAAARTRWRVAAVGAGRRRRRYRRGRRAVPVARPAGADRRVVRHARRCRGRRLRRMRLRRPWAAALPAGPWTRPSSAWKRDWPGAAATATGSCWRSPTNSSGAAPMPPRRAPERLPAARPVRLQRCRRPAAALSAAARSSSARPTSQRRARKYCKPRATIYAGLAARWRNDRRQPGPTTPTCAASLHDGKFAGGSRSEFIAYALRAGSAARQGAVAAGQRAARDGPLYASDGHMAAAGGGAGSGLLRCEADRRQHRGGSRLAGGVGAAASVATAPARRR